MGYYLAIELKDYVGYHMLGYLKNDKLVVEEIHRFEIKYLEHGGGKSLDFEELFKELKVGLRKCRENGKLPVLVGLDTWEENLILLDKEKQVLDIVVADTEGTILSKLTDMLKMHSEYKERTTAILMLPDYLNYLLTGEMLCEYTSALISGLINPMTQTWDEELLAQLGLPLSVCPNIKRPGAVIGNQAREVTEEVGFDCIFILPATHGPNSAFFALPKEELKVRNYNTKDLSPLHSTVNEAEITASVIGNLLVQLIISHEIATIEAAHTCTMNSFRMNDI